LCDPGRVPGRYLPEVIAKLIIFEGAVFPPKLFIQNLEALRNPIPWLIPFELRSARKAVRQKMEDPGRVPGRYLPEVIAKLIIFEGAVFPPKHSTHRAKIMHL
jgi:hypothetical protein